MSVYKTGVVTAIAGSQNVIGTGTAFTTYVVAGNLFRITNEATFYDIAAVYSATRLGLSGRYSNTNFNVTQADEQCATTNAASKTYAFSFDNTPVIPSSVIIIASTLAATPETFTDNGAGVITGNLGGSGTVSYDDGVVSVTFNATPDSTYTMTASYDSGSQNTAVAYNIITDYTTYYDLPEMSLNDSNFQYVYTKAMRLLDAAIYDASVNSINCKTDIEVTASPYGIVQPSPDGTRYRIKIANGGAITASAL